MQRVAIAPARDARARRWRFALLTSVLQAASIDVFAAIRQYALAKPCEANNARTTSSEPDHFALCHALVQALCEAVRVTGISVQQHNSRRSFPKTVARAAEQVRAPPIARGVAHNIGALALAAKSVDA